MLRLLCLLSALQTAAHCLERQRNPQPVEEDKGIPVPGSRPPPTMIIVRCTLEELYNGTHKSVSAVVQELDAFGSPMKVTRTYQVDVQAGWKKGTRLTYAGHGDLYSDALQRDLTFVLDEVQHPVFQRTGNDLLVQHAVSLADALSGFDFVLTHLDGRQLHVRVDEVVSPGHRKVIPCEGMPYKTGRGDLIVEFDVEFPRLLKPKDQCAALEDDALVG